MPAAEHRRPEGLGQGYFCMRCGAGGVNMYATGHGEGLCDENKALVAELVRLNSVREPHLLPAEQLTRCPPEPIGPDRRGGRRPTRGSDDLTIEQARAAWAQSKTHETAANLIEAIRFELEQTTSREQNQDLAAIAQWVSMQGPRS